jgi:chemotaxis protein histidine kinase CheA
MCLLVDRVFGHRQIVVRSLRGVVPGSEKLAGVAQLGGGRLALVLNVPDLVDSRVRPAALTA